MQLGKITETVLPPTIFVLAIIVIWQEYVVLAHVPSYLLPPPTKIASSLLQYKSVIAHQSISTIEETLIGFVLSVVAGVATAVLLAESGIARRAVYPILMAFQAVPRIALAPLMVVWFGVGLESKVSIALITAFFPVTVNMITGLSEVDPDLQDLFKLWKASRWRTFRKLRWSNSLPYLFDGLKIAIPLTMIGVIVGEFTSATSGLGLLIIDSSAEFNISLTFATLVVLAAITIVLYVAIIPFEKRFLSWRPSMRKEKS